jgi:hypothetical protein
MRRSRSSTGSDGSSNWPICLTARSSISTGSHRAQPIRSGEHGAQPELYQLTNGVGADRAMSFRPSIDIRGQSFRHFHSADGIAARTDGVVEIPFDKVRHVSIRRSTNQNM